VKSTARQVDVPRGTLQHWEKDGTERSRQAREAITEHSKVKTLAETFLKLAQAAANHSLANLDKASPYHGALISAISLDKWALITGRPTSRTEVLRARYVEPASLRSLSSGVIDVEASPQRVRGVGERAPASQLGEGQKAEKPKRKRRTKTAL
jgi:hypothetical protein